MRVAIFTDSPLDETNGVVTLLAALERWAPRTLNLSIHPPDRTQRIRVPSLRDHVRRVRDEHSDLVHFTSPGLMGLTAWRVARQLRLPLVGSCRTDHAAQLRIRTGSRVVSWLTGHYTSWLYAQCDRVIVSSAASRHRLLASQTDAARLRIWKGGVDVDVFTPERRSIAQRKMWRVSDTCPAVLYAGVLAPERGLDILPEVQRKLRELGVPHRFIVMGQGAEREALASRLDGAIFTGALTRYRSAEVFASADVFLFPSRMENAGTPVLEAQASGLPVLVSDIGGAFENMMAGRTGEVVNGADVDSWASALSRLLRDRNERERLGAAGRRYAEGRRWDVAAETLQSLYAELLVGPADAMSASAAITRRRAS